MKGSCVLFLLNLQNKLEWFILAPLLKQINPMSFTAKVQLSIQAPAHKVWFALTDPGMVKQYFYGTDLVTDWQVGHPIYFRGEWEGTPYEDKGKVLEFDPPHALAYDYLSSWSELPDLPEHYSFIRYELVENAGITQLSIIQTKLDSEEKASHSEGNWIAVMEGMKKMVEEE
jgi:uncharacterized protein YndB with AHSA1/START domain